MIIAFAGSNSSKSINYQLVKFTASMVEGYETTLLNMANYPFPLYSEDYETQKGFSNSMMELRDEIKASEGLIISVNEHNGSPSAFFKNLIDWISRLERKFLEGKKIMLMATSPGARGAIGSLEIVQKLLPRFGGEVVVTFSLPSFHQNFDAGKGIMDETLAEQHKNALNTFVSNI